MSNLDHARQLGVVARCNKAKETAEAVRWIVQPLRDQGLGLGRIAMELTAKRIATPNGKLGWRKCTVRRTLDHLGLQ